MDEELLELRRARARREVQEQRKEEVKVTIAIIVSIIVITAFFCIIWLTDEAYATEKETVNEYSAILENATDEDLDALEQVILNESVRAFGYNEEGIWECSVATAECVLNRVLSDKFPNTIHEVVYQKGQFYTKRLSGTSIQKEIVCDAIEHIWHEGRTFLPSTDYLYFATTKGVQKKYAKDFIFFGNNKHQKGHYFGRMK